MRDPGASELQYRDLRRNFRRGVPKEAIRRLLGHHSWDFTAGTYVHLDDDDLPDGRIVGDLTATAGRQGELRSDRVAG